MLIILDVIQLSLGLVLLESCIMGAHHLHLAATSKHSYMVSFSIFSAYIAFILFSCSCSDLESLAAFSSPTAKDLANSRSLGLALGFDHLEKAQTNRLVIKNMVD